MGTEALEKIFLYWLCHLPDAGALQIRHIGEAAGGFQQAYYIAVSYTHLDVYKRQVIHVWNC